MRVFTAIPLPKEIKDKVAIITKGRLPVPYVNTINLHITLNFFGELDTDEVEKIKTIFPAVCAGKKSFSIEFEKIIPRNSRQIHLMVKQTKELNELQRDLEKTFQSNGFNFQERDYSPHVKLANMHLDNVMNRDRKLENFPNEELSDLSFCADKIVLYESKLLLHHPKHIPLLEQALI